MEKDKKRILESLRDEMFEKKQCLSVELTPEMEKDILDSMTEANIFTRKNPPKFRCQKCKKEFEGEYNHLSRAFRHVKNHFRISQQEIIDGTPKLYTHYLEYWEDGQWINDQEK